MDASDIDWSGIRRVLVVRLRSIGDTVLSTPSLIALKNFLPEARIDILLEDWVAPVLDGFESVDSIVTVGEGSSSRLSAARKIRGNKYDLVFNLHGGTTSTFLTAATGARHRVGYRHYQYAFLHNHLVEPSSFFWGRDRVHSAEQQLALLGTVGVPVTPPLKTRLATTEKAVESMARRLADAGVNETQLALMHPAAAFATKQWPGENFARTAEFLSARGFGIVAVAAASETDVLRRLQEATRVPVTGFDSLILPEITALAAKASLFVGNDSGIAHIAAAVGTPTVVIFGSSNRDHWRPWTDTPNEIVFSELECQPCPGHACAEFDEPRCILGVQPQRVFEAIERVLK